MNRRLLLTTAVATALAASLALAHDAPSGWAYPAWCCSDGDCHPIADDDVKLTRGGWLIVATGEIMSFNLTMRSPDGHFHRCTIGGDPAKPTICFFAPAEGS